MSKPNALTHSDDRVEGAVSPAASTLPEREQELLKVENLRVGFPVPGGLLRAVEGVSLTIGKGEALGLVGESGSGKSVLSRSLMRLLPNGAQLSDDTEVMFDGADVKRLVGERGRHFLGVQMSMVFQDPMSSLTPVVKIGRQITEPLRYHLGLSRSQARQHAIELLDLVRIPAAESRLRQYPHELSGGMRQRIMIAIALACEPKLLIADEPTTALDVTIQQQVLDLLADLQVQRHMALLLVTHDLGVVAGRTDRVAVMYAGRIVEQAPTTALFERMYHPYTQALFGSIPRMSDPSHKRLAVVPGRPPDMSRTLDGCAFAARCMYAQPECLASRPELRVSPDDAARSFSCFFPVGTEAGDAALAKNQSAGRTAAGRTLEGTVLTW